MNDNRSVQRCLALLRSFRSGPGQSLTALSKAVDLPHSTVLRFLTTLESEGYVRKEGTLWSLTPQLLEIGFAALANTGVNDVIQSALQELADQCAGTANIGERSKNDVIIIARASSEAERRKILVVNLRVGNALPPASALCSALDLPEDQWAIARYPERKVTTVGVALFSSQARGLSLGLSVNDDDYDMPRIEAEVLPRLRAQRDHIRRLMRLGEM
ncbi:MULTISPECIES: IclR family transcriptional regulator [Bordetella]|uniref:Transcriptional regulator n=5 Tax=Pseudomonadota TaxID=1224 RepID=K0MGQ6_BORPB|nr:MULTISPECIES: helix-turn-helix domain-containing protein [Bordetella]KAK63845.1 IclR helix-turn-helix domain protein [Bordetella bronchiseptica 980-2]SHR93274.1 regulatory proteins IclR [Mycobacteroides abscessus subsp. abscessus]AMG89909.1 transcriptional regulator [Bordetella bronchiseptica]AWP76386.1 transcriptional regulator [Bordetella bronchiseptica]AWP81229.1 transcriptional regulator [Bordetella bronchiseptica]